MQNLNFELKRVCRRNRDGDDPTQRDHARVLDLVAVQPQELGYPCETNQIRYLSMPRRTARSLQQWSQTVCFDLNSPSGTTRAPAARRHRVLRASPSSPLADRLSLWRHRDGTLQPCGFSPAD